MRLFIFLLLLAGFQVNAQSNLTLVAGDSTKSAVNKTVFLSLLSQKKIVLPAGTFCLDGDIEIPSGTNLTGQPGKTKLIMNRGSGNRKFFYINAVKKKYLLYRN